MQPLSPRQVHLDFHTSELIPGVGQAFDAKAFAETARAASVSSMTVFARCHHGWLYYDSPAFPERIHPTLQNKNLLVEQVRALHAVGVRAPVYITVQWDYHSAATRPEWLIRKRGGQHEGKSFTEDGFYQSLCVNTGYADFLMAQTREVLELLGDELDGLFFDITGIRPCWCAACRRDMAARGVDATDETQVTAFAKEVIDGFKARMTALARRYSADCTIFYNAGHVGPCTRDSAAAYTHFELESLPAGGWGYLHFPVTARYARKLGRDCMGMTGKFHTSWGDFHSLKNQAALEFEAFRMLSFGFACSIGDQLEPRGVLNPATYELIGSVFAPFAQREAWARPSRPLVDAALLTHENPLVEHQIPDSILGASQLLEEIGLQHDIIDDTMDLSGYKLLLLPEDYPATGAFQRKLDAYAAAGGAILACGRGGLSAEGRYPECFGAAYAGETEKYPDFIVAEGALCRGLAPGNEYVVYLQGASIRPQGGEVALQAHAPYFKREGNRFCSHRYTPSSGGETHPVAVRKDRVILFSHPLFTQYRDNAPRWVKQLLQNAIDFLLPAPILRHNGPSTLSVQVLDQPEAKRVCAHVLSYIPVRKSATIDIIEERAQALNVSLTLTLPRGFQKAFLQPEGTALPVSGNTVTIPVVDGYAIVELPYAE